GYNCRPDKITSLKCRFVMYTAQATDLRASSFTILNQLQCTLTSIRCMHWAHSDTILQAVTYHVAINGFCECFEKRPRFRFWNIDPLDRHAHLSRGSEYAMRHALHRIVPKFCHAEGRNCLSFNSGRGAG